VHPEGYGCTRLCDLGQRSRRKHDVVFEKSIGT